MAFTSNLILTSKCLLKYYLECYCYVLTAEDGEARVIGEHDVRETTALI